MILRANSGPMGALTRPGLRSFSALSGSFRRPLLVENITNDEYAPFPPLLPSGEGAAIGSVAKL